MTLRPNKNFWSHTVNEGMKYLTKLPLTTAKHSREIYEKPIAAYNMSTHRKRTRATSSKTLSRNDLHRLLLARCPLPRDLCHYSTLYTHRCTHMTAHIYTILRSTTLAAQPARHRARAGA